MATFYSAVLEWDIVQSDEQMWFIRAEHGDSIGFQKVANYRPPQWPDQDVPQQMHLDLAVDDLDVAEKGVLALGAIKHEHQPGTTFRVFLDPAGHPFCLCAC
jgi:predicted enzyme related to lactoylglutathione lyase